MSTHHHPGIALAIALIATPLLAHGGAYRGPGETVPPGGGASSSVRGSGGGASTGAGASTGGPSSAPASGSGGGSTSGPSFGAARSGGRTPRGISLGEDYSQWQFWWEFNKEPLLDRRRALSGRSDADGVLGRALASSKAVQPPSRNDLLRLVVPALRATLNAPSSGPDIVSSCMVALARIGDDVIGTTKRDGTSAERDLVDTLRPFLETSKHQEKRETAALALGISGSPRAVPLLLELAHGKLGDSEVDVRTRSFALYGLAALIARRPDAIHEPASLQESMRRLAMTETLREDVRVAALHVLPALASLPKIGKHLARHSILCCESLTRDRDQRLAAHAMIALGRTLAARPETEHRESRRWLIEKLTDRSMSRQLHRSTSIAVGNVARRDPSLRKAASESLQSIVRAARDIQSRRFALMALARVGGRANEEFLRKRLLSTKLQDADRVWAALALGILGHSLDSKESQRLTRIGEDLQRAFKRTHQALPASGIALALGLVHHKDSGDAILERMLKDRSQQEPAGYFALALGLLRHESSRDEIRELVLGATRQELLLTQGAIALGLLGDPEIVDRLSARLTTSGSISAKSSLARALGFLGDRRSLKPLAELMADNKKPDLPRAFAAVALGLACDTESMPWNARFAVDCNYRAMLGTLVGGTAGILDIL